MVDDEKLGYHKGALESLINEKAELGRLLQIVNSLIERHSKALNKMGVDVEKFMKNLQERQQQKAQKQRGPKGGKGRSSNYDLSEEELPE